MIECTICSEIKKLPKVFWEDMKKFGSPDFKKERWNLHFGYSSVISFFTMWFMNAFMYLNDTPLLFNLFVGWFSLFGINFVREWIMGIKYKAPFDMRDVRMGAYGGLVGALIFKILQMIFLC